MLVSITALKLISIASNSLPIIVLSHATPCYIHSGKLIFHVEAPDTPSHLQVTNITSDSALLSWSAGSDGGRPQMFILTVNEKDIATNIKNPTQGMVVSYELMNLESNTKYTVQVFAKSEVGSSELSTPVTFTTVTLDDVGMY